MCALISLYVQCKLKGWVLLCLLNSLETSMSYVGAPVLVLAVALPLWLLAEEPVECQWIMAQVLGHWTLMWEFFWSPCLLASVWPNSPSCCRFLRKEPFGVPGWVCLHAQSPDFSHHVHAVAIAGPAWAPEDAPFMVSPLRGEVWRTGQSRAPPTANIVLWMGLGRGRLLDCWG